MNKLTIEYLNSLIKQVEYVHQGLLTICTITLKNGFQLVGTSACVCADNFDSGIGEKVAKENALNRLWELEGYLLKQRIYEQQCKNIGENNNE